MSTTFSVTFLKNTGVPIRAMCENSVIRVLTQTLRLRHAIMMFGILNACLYSALLPLWEGFDEAFHYGYVETLWQTHRLFTPPG